MAGNRIALRQRPQFELTPWNPWREMDYLFNRFFESPTGGESRQAWQPTLDAYDTPEAFVLLAVVPGADETAFDVQVSGSTVAVSGRRKAWIEGENVTTLFSNGANVSGEFSFRYDFSADIDATNVKATYRSGILEIRLPKVQPTQPQSIKVEVQAD